MATLLDLTTQGDVGTMSDSSKLSSFKLMDPQQLYGLWEKQNWQSATIDFTQDREDWLALSDADRHSLSWNLSSFFVGEERVTTQFSGLVMSYESQGEEAFLATQQVDEARHAQHFNNFYREVLQLDGTFETRLERARGDINDAFVKLFDEDLVESAKKLVADPSDMVAKVEFVTLYHMVIEGTLALSGQNFLTDFCEKRGILPGFVEGFKLISQDEHRHVAYGTWLLQQKARDPQLKEVIQRKLMEVLPTAALVLVPTGQDPNGDWNILGYGSAEVNEFAFTALSRRLKVVGVELGVPAAA
jgi:ribonucleoside-diphosphate reductase beta chain